MDKFTADHARMALFGLVMLCATCLVATNKLPPEVFQALLAWLIPSPISFKKDTANDDRNVRP